MTRTSWGWPRRLSAPLVVACISALAVAFTGVPAASQATGEMKTFDNAQFGFTVVLPSGCRHDEGPGTIDAICSADLDPQKGATADKLNAFVLQVGAETLADDAGRTPGELAQRYSEAAFKEELPEAVCGEADAARTKVENVKSILEEARVVYTADVVCSEIKFLQVGRRKAAVRHLITPTARYRLVARAPLEDFDKQWPVIVAFFASFRAAPVGK